MKLHNQLHHFFNFTGGAGFLTLLVGMGVFAYTASAADLTIPLPGAAPISRKSQEYKCDAAGAKIGTPTGTFRVEYINAGGNSLVLVPIAGNLLIFSNVTSASGARYTAQTYTWWEAGGAVTLYSDSLAGKMQSTCRQVSSK